MALFTPAARVDRSNDKDRARGVFVEAMTRQRGERKALIGTIVVGIFLVVLAVGASMDEWIAALLGAGALMWLPALSLAAGAGTAAGLIGSKV